MQDDPRTFLLNLFNTAVAEVAPENCLLPFVPVCPKGRAIIVGAGKSAAAMAQVLEGAMAAWPDVTGLVITPYGHGLTTRVIEVAEASHPVPDHAGECATRRIKRLVEGLDSNDLVICLISGGGSALLSSPAKGLSLEDKQSVTQDLLRCGATITEINTVRKHLSEVKGGRLAAAAFPAQVLALIISDVAGDDVATIASGPTVADPTTFADARAVIDKYQLVTPRSVITHLEAAVDETPKPGNSRLVGSTDFIVASSRKALAAAAHEAKSAGYRVVIVGDDLEGEARDLAGSHVTLAHKYLKEKQPTVLLSGGEATVTVSGSGRGGPNTEYLLALAIGLNKIPGVFALACDTDGIDGSENNAGAFISPDSLDRSQTLSLNPGEKLNMNDSYGFFAPLGDLVITGPTRTNVNDFRAMLIIPT